MATDTDPNALAEALAACSPGTVEARQAEDALLRALMNEDVEFRLPDGRTTRVAAHALLQWLAQAGDYNPGWSARVELEQLRAGIDPHTGRVGGRR